jgi:hypothetical protein
VLLSISIEPLSFDGLPVRHTCATLLPNKYYKAAPLAFLRRWGLPPATPGFGESWLLTSGWLHAAKGWQRLEDTLPWPEAAHAETGTEDWGPPVEMPWRVGEAPPECTGSRECTVLAAAYEQWRSTAAGKPPLQQQMAYWGQVDEFWQQHQRRAASQQQQEQQACVQPSAPFGGCTQHVTHDTTSSCVIAGSAAVGSACLPTLAAPVPAAGLQAQGLWTSLLQGMRLWSPYEHFTSEPRPHGLRAPV